MILLNTENKFMTKERPILFSAPMVLAILDGRKTQTRRIAKVTSDGCKEGFITPLAGFVPRSIENHFSYCPYGKPGERLWVRETWSKAKSSASQDIFYRADGETNGKQYALSFVERESKWRPSIHMPRSASRILLEITGVRVERLQDISEDDAIADGVYEGGKVCICETPLDFVRSCGNCGGRLIDAVDMYKQIWQSLNGIGSWDLNQWVWVVEFKVLETGK